MDSLHCIALYFVFRLYDSALAIILLKATWLDMTWLSLKYYETFVASTEWVSLKTYYVVWYCTVTYAVLFVSSI